MVASAPMQLAPHVTVIQSTVPKEDANTVLTLVPDMFVLESSTNESVVLCGKSSTSSIIFLHAPVTHDQVVPLVVTEEQIETARERCNDMGNETAKDISVNSRLGVCTLCLIRLCGGSFILFTPPSLAASRTGRTLITRALTKSFTEVSSETEQEENEVTARESNDELVDIQVERESPDERNGGAIMEEQDYTLAKFPSLAVSVLGKNGDYVAGFPINSQDAVPVETDLFKGRMLMLVKPLRPEDDPYWTERLFSKKKRRFLFQLQGKFKRVPQGTLYAGGEISDQMKLGLLAKGICGLLLKFIKSVAPDTHYSFGDSNDKEKPHIVVPAWSFFERLVITKPGEVPPEMGEEFVESEESLAARQYKKSQANWNTEDTYSMSFYTMYLDFAKWQVVQIPVTSDLDLKTFWSNSFLRIVLFENTTPPKDGRHLQKDNAYFFAVELRHVSVARQDDEVEDRELTPQMPWDKPRSGSLRLLKDSGRQESGGFLAETYGDDLFFDAEEESSLHELEDESFHPTSTLDSRSRPSIDLLSKIDTICPAMFEIHHKGKYIKTYAFNLTKKGGTVFRTPACVEEYFATSNAKQAAEEMWSPRLSSSERCRRILGQTISRALSDDSASGISRISEFAELETAFDSDFLRREEPSWFRRQKLKVCRGGYGARAMSDHHWMEEWVQITDRYLLFHNPEKQKAHLRISLRSIVDVKCLPSADAPVMSSYCFIAVATLGRIIYVMFRSHVESQDWVHLIAGLIAMRNACDTQPSLDSLSASSDHTISFDDPTDEFLQESSMWNCKQRRILNGRQFSFNSTVRKTEDAVPMVTDALVRALDQTDEDESSMIAFLDSVAALKNVDVYVLDEQTRLVFFLNLYHAMIMHAYLVLGPPDSSFKWISYFNTIAYQCSDDVFSLTELEHCIIRAAMNYPSQFVSKFVLPKSKYSFALSRSDYRINFALNCGSMSNPEVIPVYEAHRLDEQLEEASRCYMEYAAEARKSTRRVGGVTLTLPKICQWFAEDFGNGSTNDIVRCIQRFLSEDERALVASSFWKNEDRYNFSDLNVKYASYNFECRTLKLTNGEST